ncbi:MAG: hypothetical protein HYU30_07315 [Chloroflexi bacterium]|nr:hypothetical protein [Chloroflexota bacterium]
MQKRSQLLLLLTITIIGVWFITSSLASQSSEATRRSSLEASGAPGLGTHPKTPHDLMVEVADTVPGFAGLYFEGDVLNVVLVHPSPEAAQRAAELYFGNNDDRLSRAREIRAVQGQYDGKQLKAWFDALHTVAIEGRSGISIRTDKNRVWIGVKDEASRNRTQEALAQLGIPPEAVIIEVGVFWFASSHEYLTGYVNPYKGGLATDAYAGGCTLGPTVTLGGTAGNLSPTHCSRYLGTVDNTGLYQPNYDPSNNPNNYISYETADPSFFTSAQNSQCPPNRLCRYSDASFYKEDNANRSRQQGRVARTVGSYTTEISHNFPTFRIVDFQNGPVIGEVLTKVGRVNGTLSGQVTDTCATIDWSGTSYTFLCQGVMTVNQASGESGAPVFYETNSPQYSDAKIYGMATLTSSAGQAGFSLVNSLFWELGNLKWCDPSFTC